MDTNPADLVRSGYNALSHHYRGDDDTAHEYDRWLADLRDRLPERGQILDIGCGCGIPLVRHLTAAGHQVTGVDIRDAQIQRARRLVPGATFIRADATEMDFPPGSFDAVICLCALIHMPLDRQPRLLHDIARWLRPGGWLLAATGQDPWTAARTTGAAAALPLCGGATPTPPPTGPGSAKPAWRSPASSSFPRATAATPSSGHASRPPAHPRNPRPIQRKALQPALVDTATWARTTETNPRRHRQDHAHGHLIARASVSLKIARPGATAGNFY